MTDRLTREAQRAEAWANEFKAMRKRAEAAEKALAEAQASEAKLVKALLAVLQFIARGLGSNGWKSALALAEEALRATKEPKR